MPQVATPTDKKNKLQISLLYKMTYNLIFMSSRFLLVNYPYNTKISPKKLFLHLPATAQHCHCILPRGLRSLAGGRLGPSNLSAEFFFLLTRLTHLLPIFSNSSLLHLTLSLLTYHQSVDNSLLKANNLSCKQTNKRNKNRVSSTSRDFQLNKEKQKT